MKFSIQFRKWLILNGLTLLGLLPVRCSSDVNREENEDNDSEDLSLHGFACSNLMPLLDSVYLTSKSSVQKTFQQNFGGVSQL